MSHLHVVDGVLPWWLVLGSLLVAGILAAAVLRGRGEAARVLFLARVGVTAAFLLVAMSLPLGPGLHLSLAPLAGMMLGPGGGFLAAFLANGTLATLGHGGVTAIGVNGLFLGGQAVLGAGLFALLRRFLGMRAAAVASSAATLTLAVAAAIVALRFLEVDPGGHHEDHGVEWGTWILAALAAAAVVVEVALTASVVTFLSRVRGDLVHGGVAPRPRTSGEPA